MNPRSFIAAAPSAAAQETPVAALFREWEVAKVSYNGADEANDAEEYAHLCAVEDEILAATPATVEEYALKLIVLNDFAPITGCPWGDAMMAEARALIG